MQMQKRLPRGVLAGTFNLCFLIWWIMEALVTSTRMRATGKKPKKSAIGGRARTMAGGGPRILTMVAEVYLPPTAGRGAWVLMSPAQLDPG